MIKHHLMQDYDVDIYAHLWWDASYKDQIIRFEFKDTYEYDAGKEFLKLYKPKSYKFEPQKDFDLSAFNFNNHGVCANEFDAKVCAFNLSSMWYSVQEAYNLALESDVEYDIYVRCRTDLAFTEAIPFDNFAPNQLYVADGRTAGADRHCADWFAYGNMENMNKYCNLKALFPDCNSNGIMHMHEFIENALMTQGCMINFWTVRCYLSQMVNNFILCKDSDGFVAPNTFKSKWESGALAGSANSLTHESYIGRPKEQWPHYAKGWKNE